MIDEPAARALSTLLPGVRRRRWLLFLIDHPECEADAWFGRIILAVKNGGDLGVVHIDRHEEFNLEVSS